jgi:hypothetical protein
VDPARDCRQEIALGQDPDESAEVHDESGAYASAGHLLCRFAKRVLGSDCQEIARHYIAKQASHPKRA